MNLAELGEISKAVKRLPGGGKVRLKVRRGKALTEVGAYTGGKNVGYLEIRPDQMVNHVQVLDDYQRRGIGRAMWAHAKKRGLSPKHNYANQTDAGSKWAKAVED